MSLKIRNAVSAQRLGRLTPYPRASPTPQSSTRSSHYPPLSSPSPSPQRLQLRSFLDQQVLHRRKTLEIQRKSDYQFDISTIKKWKEQEKLTENQIHRDKYRKIENRRKLEKEYQDFVMRKSLEVKNELEIDRKRLTDQLNEHKKTKNEAKIEKQRIKALLQSMITANNEAAKQRIQAKLEEIKADRERLETMKRVREKEELGKDSVGVKGPFERRKRILQREKQREYRETLDRQVAAKRRRDMEQWEEEV